MKQTRNLEDLLRQYDLLAAPAARDAAVTGICNDSRRARDGDLFICKGYGFKPEYLAMARRQGAVCALAEWLRFMYNGMEVMVNTNEAASGGGWNFTGAEIVKHNAPVSIVDTEIFNTNQDLADAVMFD